FGQLTWLASIFYGLKPAVLAIVAAAVIRIGQRALKNEVMWSLAGAAFVALFFFKAPFPLIILAAGISGWFGGKLWPRKFLARDRPGAGDGAGEPSLLSDATESPAHARPSLG